MEAIGTEEPNRRATASRRRRTGRVGQWVTAPRRCRRTSMPNPFRFHPIKSIHPVFNRLWVCVTFLREKNVNTTQRHFERKP